MDTVIQSVWAPISEPHFFPSVTTSHILGPFARSLVRRNNAEVGDDKGIANQLNSAKNITLCCQQEEEEPRIINARKNFNLSKKYF